MKSNEFSHLKPPKVEEIVKQKSIKLVPSLDLTELEPLEGANRMYFCRKDFGCSRIVTKEIEKVSELRKLNTYIAMNQTKLDAQQLHRLNDYKVLIKSFIDKFSQDKANYQKRYPHVKHSERNAHKWKYEVLQMSGKKTIENASKDASIYVAMYAEAPVGESQRQSFCSSH